MKSQTQTKATRNILMGLALLLGAGPGAAKEVRVACRNDAGDSALINMAIASSEAGDEIVIDGPASISQTIKLLGGRTYRGEGRNGTVIKQADGANLEAVLASDSFLNNSKTTGLPVTISRLTIDGNKRQNTAKTAGIVLRSWLSVVEDVQVRQAGGDGIRLTSVSADGTRLTNTQVNGRISNCFITDSGGHGVWVQDPGNSCTDWVLRDNWIAQSGIDGIHLENGAGWYVDGNHVYGAPRHAIYVDRAYATSVSNNYIEGFGETKTTGTYYGIGVTLQGNVGSTIAGNRIFNFGGEDSEQSRYSYIAIVQVNYKAGRAVVTGNTVGGTGTASSIGLDYNKGGRPDTTLTVTSSGNAVTNVGQPRRLGAGVTLDAGL
jgi:hypothetical protein